MIDVIGVPTTAGSRAVAEHAQPASADATCLRQVRRLVDAGKARLVGKVNLHELAYGVSGINSGFGTPVNPVDPRRVPGGSSSGSAVAVATGEADVAFGTDTGGSVRIPAACCGVAGLKTTWGRIPLVGIRPLAPSLDTVGPLARDVDGVLLGMQLLEPGFSIGSDPPVRVGRLRPTSDPSIDTAVDRVLRIAGLEVIDVTLPGWGRAWSAAEMLAMAEAWQSNRGLLDFNAELMGRGVRQRIAAGKQVSDRQVFAARRAQGRWRVRLLSILSEVRVLALPTLSCEPPPLDSPAFPATRLTLPVNFAGLPALALPIPRRDGPPASLQLIGGEYGEEMLLALGASIEQAMAAT
jgi:amidase